MRASIDVRGVAVPHFMYGTAWKEERTEGLVRQALEAGFRAFDTANQRKHYFETGVGRALATAVADGLVTRDELFLQTKFTYERGQDHRLPYDPSADFATQVTQSFKSSLEHLGTTSIDSYVLHGPYEARGIAAADREVWRAMEGLLEAGQVKLLGVSNVSPSQLDELVSFSAVPIAFVQNRCFARAGWDRDVRQVCREAGIVYQGFSLLTANDRELRSPVVVRIAERHRATVPQVVFRFALALGMLPLTGTSNPEHMRQDLDAARFTLEPDELSVLESIGLAGR